MKILFITWSSYGVVNWINAMKCNGHDVTEMIRASLSEDEDKNLQEQIIRVILDGRYDAVCSFNFFPILSIVAKKANCKYIAWVYDSPLLHLYSIEITNSNNYIFLFDKKQYEELYQIGIQTVYHLPLAGVVDKAEEPEDYCSDITFVGNLYRNNNFYDNIVFLPEKLRGYLDGVMDAQRKIYGYYLMPELLTDNIIEDIKKYVKFDLGDQFFVDDRIIFSSLFLAKKVANLERESILNNLAKYFKVRLYSNEKIENKNIENCGTIDYGNEMYKLFRHSRININSTLRCIQTGINLRTMDILSAGGFCLTNYQEELSDYFKIGEDLVVYESELDLLEKAAYFLKNEDHRREIAKNGQKRIEECLTFDKQVNQMMKIVMQ